MTKKMEVLEKGIPKLVWAASQFANTPLLLFL
jgi:hypothetical protein